MFSQYTISPAYVQSIYHLSCLCQARYHLNAHVQSEYHLSYPSPIRLLHVLLISSYTQSLLPMSSHCTISHAHVQSVHTLSYPCPVSTPSSTHTTYPAHYQSEFYLFCPYQVSTPSLCQCPVRVPPLLPISYQHTTSAHVQSEYHLSSHPFRIPHLLQQVQPVQHLSCSSPVNRPSPRPSRNLFILGKMMACDVRLMPVCFKI